MSDGTKDDLVHLVSRRAALRTLGLAAGGVAAAGAAAACKPTTPNGSPTGQSTGDAKETSNKPADAAGAASAGFFTPHELATATVLADYVIPRDARSGSASDAGVPAWMNEFLAHPDTQAPASLGADAVSLPLAIRGGLAWLDAESRRRGGVDFVTAADPARRAILDDIAYPKRAPKAMAQGVAFFNRFRDLTASGFFSSETGWKDLQYLGNVAVPVWDGCPPAALAKLGVSYDLMATRVQPETNRRT
jgi:hypothetical protein